MTDHVEITHVMGEPVATFNVYITHVSAGTVTLTEPRSGCSGTGETWTQAADQLHTNIMALPPALRPY